MADPRKASSSSGRGKQDGGAAVGDFLLGAEIGKGSFAQVYMGWHKVSKSAVAIKSVELARLNKKLKENLYGEIQILKTLRHPHIVALHDCVESATHINLVMEYCELGDLSLFIKKREKLGTHPVTYDMARKYPIVPNAGLNEVVIRHFLKQLASALKFLREKNYIHRDVKPQNLLLLPSPEYRKTHPRDVLEASQDSLIPIAGLTSLPMLKLADFGFARVLPSTSLADTLCGSPLYMAPEILRYERYDAKADLWSVGTVAFEMATGRPPFRARNHVELLRKIEAAEDVIKFPREADISQDLKGLIRSLLKRIPVERLSFEKFFEHPVVTGPIPGVVEDDLPKAPRREPKPIQTSPATGDTPPRRYAELAREQGSPRSPREAVPRSPQAGSPGGMASRQEAIGRTAQDSRGDVGAGLGIRPRPHSFASAPPRTHRISDPLANRIAREGPSSPPSSLLNENGGRPPREVIDEQEKAAQDVAFERDYVVVEKKHVEVNAFADMLAASPRFAGQQGQATSPRAGQVVRRGTGQTGPVLTAGSVPTQSSRAIQIAPGGQRPTHDRRSSYDKAMSGGSPVSTSSAISKAIQDASLRLFGIKVPPPRLGKGPSPPMYNPFPTYPASSSSGHAGLLGDGKQSATLHEDGHIFKRIEDCANKSDVVYWFAEVKFKQLFPLAPSMDHGLGGPLGDEMASREEGLTPDAVVALSEEALVLYVKALAMLAKAMDVANVWWSGKGKGEPAGSIGALKDASSPHSFTGQILSAVQWVRQRFNETLEKTEVVRLKLIEAQKQLPEDHPSHPNNHGNDSTSSTGSGMKQVFLTPGISAGKLMYERAIDMSKGAAIDEIANENLTGCEAHYLTAIQMLQAVLESDDDADRLRSGSSKDVRGDRDGLASDLDNNDREAVLLMIDAIKGRLKVVRSKKLMIAEAERSHRARQGAVRRRSGDVTPRSARSHTSS